MAIIDSEHDRVVVRIVYDGPPFAGKTTNLRALREALKTSDEVYSPEQENSQTSYFEWLNYVGGVFNGRSIACQIVSVPGAPELEARRRYLLRSADAVVFVLDARVPRVAVGLEYFRSLRETLEDLEPAVGILVQANYQDTGDALNEERLRLFFPEGIRVMDASAALGKGVRDTFVFAVSLAVERLRKIMQQGKLIMDTPEIPDGEALYHKLHDHPLDPPSDQLLPLLLD